MREDERPLWALSTAEVETAARRPGTTYPGQGAATSSDTIEEWLVEEDGQRALFYGPI